MPEVIQRVPLVCSQNGARPRPAPIHYPPELVLSTIKCLRDDCRGLQVCMLVCKTWYTFTRPFLYEAVTIRNEGKVKDIMATIARNPEIAEWIKELRVFAPYNSRRLVYWSSGVGRLVDCLRNFQTLEFGREVILFKLQYFHVFASIRNLRLTRLTLSQIYLMDILANLSLLSSFGLYYCLAENSSVSEGGFALPIAFQHNPHLRCSHFSWTTTSGPNPPVANDFIRWLQTSGVSDTLRTVAFYLHCKSSQSLAEVGDFLKTIGDTLEGLALGVSLDHMPWSICTEMHGTYLTPLCR